MPWTLANGPPETNAIHLWTPSASSSAVAPPAINDPGGAFPANLPWIKLLRVNGYRKAPEKEDNREGRTYGVGEMMYPPRVLGKTLGYELEARSNTDQECAQLVTACLNGFYVGDVEEGTMTVTPFASIGGNAWTYSAAVIDVDPGEGFTFSRKRRGYFRWRFTIALRMSDPVFYTTGGSSL